MRQELLIETGQDNYMIAKGCAELYVLRRNNTNRIGRRYHIRTLKQGDKIAGFAPLEAVDGVWIRLLYIPDDTYAVKWEGDLEQQAAEMDELREKITQIQQWETKEAANYNNRTQRSSQHIRRSADVLTNEASGGVYGILYDGAWEVCREIARYLHVQISHPVGELRRNGEVFAETMLHTSGLQSQKITLRGNWWKNQTGPMLGSLHDGSPVALLPGFLFGYVMIHPKTRRRVRVDGAIASELSQQAIAVLRTFPKKKMGAGEVVRFLAGERVHREIALILLCGMVSAIIGVLSPIVSAQIFDVVVPENLRGILFEIIFVVLAFEAANIGVSMISNLGICRIYTRMELTFQAALWDKLLRLPMGFFSSYSSGELLQKMNGVEQIKRVLSVDNISPLLTALFSFVNVIVLFRYNDRITPYVLLMFLMALLIYYIAGRKKVRLNQEYAQVSSRLSSINHQILDGIQRVKTSAAEKNAFFVWSKYEAERRNLSSEIKRIDSSLAAFYQFFQYCSPAFVYLLIFLSGDMEMGGFVAYIATFLILQRALLDVFNISVNIPDLIPAAQDILPILEESPEYIPGKRTPNDLDGSLEVSHLTFRYRETGQTILHDVSFRVEPGQCIGIWGPSGCGKTTLLRALLGFYPLQRGSIYYGGYDLDVVDLQVLRRHLSVVMQNNRLKTGSILHILSDGTRGQEEAIQAIEAVKLQEVIEALPQGIQTDLQDCPLSDGETQRLLIARALCKGGQYLFLDEASTNLDNLMQKEIMGMVASRSVTSIIVAQRLSALQFCDKILLFKNGSIVEECTYDQLVNRQASPETEFAVRN